MNPKVLILDGNQRASLAAVRSLGAKGFWIGVGESSSTSLAGCSKFCQRSIKYTSPSQSTKEFVEDISATIKELDIGFLLPISEATVYALLQYRTVLPDNVILPFACNQTVESLGNKNRLFSLAGSLGVPYPETIFCDGVQSGLDAVSRLEKFPIVLKPCKSKIIEEDRVISTQVVIAESAEEAKKHLVTKAFFRHPFTIQSFVDGHGEGVFALFDKGSPVCFFSHKRLREKPPGGGVSVLSESTSLDKDLKNYAERLLGEVKWHGVAMVEFKVADDGGSFLMEINPRFWGSLQLAIDSGFDFPWLLYLTCTGQDLPEIKSKRRRVRWVLGDLDRLAIILKAPSSTYPLRHKVWEVLKFFKPNLRTRHEVNRWSDPKPFLFELKQYLCALKN